MKVRIKVVLRHASSIEIVRQYPNIHEFSWYWNSLKIDKIQIRTEDDNSMIKLRIWNIKF
jgi:hypothetical protein